MGENKSANVGFVDGQMVDWDSMSMEDLDKMRKKYKAKEKKILEEINKQIKSDFDDIEI